MKKLTYPEIDKFFFELIRQLNKFNKLVFPAPLKTINKSILNNFLNTRRTHDS